MVTCTRCETSKPDDSFYPAVAQRGKGWCKECFNDHRRPMRRVDSPGRLHTACLECASDMEGRRRHARFCSAACAARFWRKANPGATRAYMVKCSYGITQEAFTAMFTAQGSRCAICRTETPAGHGRVRQWNIDHDHATGRVRGILCSQCNIGIGQLRDDPELLRRAIDYLTGKWHRPSPL